MARAAEQGGGEGGEEEMNELVKNITRAWVIKQRMEILAGGEDGFRLLRFCREEEMNELIFGAQIVRSPLGASVGYVEFSLHDSRGVNR